MEDITKKREPIESFKLAPSATPKEDEKILHTLKLLVVGILCFAVLVFIFGVGVFVGQKRAEFSFRWAEDYHRNFGGPNRGFFNNFPATDFINNHGVFGPIISIDTTANTLVVEDRDHIEKTIAISSTTTIVNNAGIAKAADLKVGESVVVIGAPNDQGQIDARLIRVMPAGASTTSFIINAYQLGNPKIYEN